MSKPDSIPSYNRIQIQLPQVPGWPQLTPSIYFDIDTRFTTAQTQRIQTIIVRVIIAWNMHFREKEPTPYLSRLAMCSQKYSINNLTPLWSKRPCITSGTEAANLAMDTLAQLFIKFGNSRNDVPKVDYYLLKPGKYLNIRSQATKKMTMCYNKLTLSVTINPQIIDDTTITDLNLAGSLLHAWLHGMGFIHPEGIYTTYFIAEAPMCVMRGYQDKVPNQSDTLQTQYFD